MAQVQVWIGQAVPGRLKHTQSSSTCSPQNLWSYFTLKWKHTHSIAFLCQTESDSVMSGDHSFNCRTGPRHTRHTRHMVPFLTRTVNLLLLQTRLVFSLPSNIRNNHHLYHLSTQQAEPKNLPSCFLHSFERHRTQKEFLQFHVAQYQPACRHPQTRPKSSKKLKAADWIRNRLTKQVSVFGTIMKSINVYHLLPRQFSFWDFMKSTSFRLKDHDRTSEGATWHLFGCIPCLRFSFCSCSYHHPGVCLQVRVP